jgi:predicted DNA-binding protein
MSKLCKTLILRISESHLKLILNASIKEQKSKSLVIREAIQKHIVNEKNR